jgi:sulfur carrier protein ThiS
VSSTSRAPEPKNGNRGAGAGKKGEDRIVKVMLRNPTRELDVPGPLRVQALLERLDINREAVLVISDGTLVTGDALLAAEVTVEIRPVISGGAW